VLGPELGPEFVRGVDSGIDVSSQTLLSASQRRHDALERCVTDDEQVDVARRPELTTGRRPEHQRHEHAFAQWCERLAEYVGEPGSLREQSLQLRKDRRLAVSLEIHLPALNSAAQQPSGGQLLEFALHRADGSTCVACDLAKIVRFVGVTEQPAEDAPACTAEQQRGDICRRRRSHGCSHDAYNRTQSGNSRSTIAPNLTDGKSITVGGCTSRYCSSDDADVADLDGGRYDAISTRPERFTRARCGRRRMRGSKMAKSEMLVENVTLSRTRSVVTLCDYNEPFRKK
jgi:hypothetical protein